MKLVQYLPCLAIAALAPLTSGCGNLQVDRCEAVCACENCGEQAAQDCDIIVEADFAVAETYGCAEILEPYWECQLDRHECDDNHYRDDEEECRNQYDQYRECLDARSTREGGPY